MNKIVLHYSNNSDYGERILKLLKQTNIPLPLNLIAKICRIPKDRCCRVLQSLEKYGLVKKKTVQKAVYYANK